MSDAPNTLEVRGGYKKAAAEEPLDPLKKGEQKKETPAAPAPEKKGGKKDEKAA